MNSQYVRTIAFFILTFVWIYSLGVFSYWVVYRHIRTKRALKILNYIQAFAVLIGCCFAVLILNSVYEIDSIPADERSNDGVALFLASIAFPMIAVFLTMRFCFPKVFKQRLEITASLK
jgi:hypothetical protein